MKSITSHVLPALVFLSAAGADTAAQSLVEVARQERLRREALARQAGPDAAPPRVYTDADLVYSGRLTMRVGDDEANAGAEAGEAATDPETPAAPPRPRPPATKTGGATAWPRPGRRSSRPSAGPPSSRPA